jgi:CBS domain-containing protein
MLDRWIHTQTGVAGDVEAARRLLADDAAAVVRRALDLGGGEPREDGTFSLYDMVVRDADVERVELRASIGTPEMRAHDEVLSLPLGWEPEVNPDAYSRLQGELTLGDDGVGRAVLGFNGRYQVPPAGRRRSGVIAATQRLVRQVVRAIGTEIGAALGAEADQTSRHDRLQVRDLMTSDPIVLRTDQSLLAATLVLLHHRIAGAPVVDEHGALVGVLSESDMLAREATPRQREGWLARDEERRRWAFTVGEACSRPAIKVHPETSAREAARMLLDRDVGRLVVVEADKVVGVLARHDVLRALTRTAEELLHAVERALEPLGDHDISVSVDVGSHVVLFGDVPDDHTAERAEQLVLAVDGVTGLDNRLEVTAAQ